MQEVASTTVSTYSAPIAPCACRAILPVSNDKVRPPTSKLTFSNIKHVLFSPIRRSLIQIRETTLGNSHRGRTIAKKGAVYYRSSILAPHSPHVARKLVCADETTQP